MTRRKPEGTEATRRQMLKRLGLAASAFYVAPALMHLGHANASSFSFSVSYRPRRRRAPARQAAPAAPEPPPELLVASPSAADIDAIAAEGFGLIARDRIETADLELARFSLPAGIGLDQARQQISEGFPTALIDVNHLYRPEEFACAGDDCAAFEAVGWDETILDCEASVELGLIDTTINPDHAALDGVDIERFPSIAEDRTAASAVHGTAIAILLAGRRDTRTPGLLSQPRLIAAEAFHQDGAGNDVADAYDIARAIDDLSERGIRIINLSFSGPDNAVLGRVVETALDADIILVAAAGNAGPNADPLYPAAYEGVVAVTAVDRNNRVYRQANAGDHVDFAAPGVRLWTAASISGGRFRSGTSYAAPFVSAMLALARTASPEADTATLIDRLAADAVDLGEDGRDPVYGWGLVQAQVTCPGSSGSARAGG